MKAQFGMYGKESVIDQRCLSRGRDYIIFVDVQVVVPVKHCILRELMSVVQHNI
jgi:hypothetical protein